MNPKTKTNGCELTLKVNHRSIGMKPKTTSTGVEPTLKVNHCLMDMKPKTNTTGVELMLLPNPVNFRMGELKTTMTKSH